MLWHVGSLLVVLSSKLCPFLLRIQLSHLILVFIRFLLSHKLGTMDAVPVLRFAHGLPLICCLDPAGSWAHSKREYQR